MSYARVMKQAGYAFGCLAMVSGVVLALFFLIAGLPESSAPIPTPTISYEPIVVDKPAVVRHAQSADIVVRLRNPNSRAGIVQYPVTFILNDEQGQEIIRKAETSYLLPGSLQYIAVFNVPVANERFAVRVEVPENPTFTQLPESLSLPVFGSFLRERRTRQIGGDTIEEQKGIARNNGTFDFGRVELTAIAEDGQGNIVGVGKTFLGELKVGEQREFTVQWPAPLQPTAKVSTLLTTNIFLEETLIRVIGDPSTLR